MGPSLQSAHSWVGIPNKCFMWATFCVILFCLDFPSFVKRINSFLVSSIYSSTAVISLITLQGFFSCLSFCSSLGPWVPTVSSHGLILILLLYSNWLIQLTNLVFITCQVLLRGFAFPLYKLFKCWSHRDQMVFYPLDVSLGGWLFWDVWRLYWGGIVRWDSF